MQEERDPDSKFNQRKEGRDEGGRAFQREGGLNGGKGSDFVYSGRSSRNKDNLPVKERSGRCEVADKGKENNTIQVIQLYLIRLSVLLHSSISIALLSA